MHIEEIIIDGFKSYSTRVPVGPFDRQFNAITGLNGSGKSNILDAICFVLGISNLTQVRVGNLSELVYKQGQAGVTKASVTIVFNNEDKQNSPVGYEMHDKIIITRQIVIGGRNRYLLNSHNVQQNQIQNLFHSVSLNVNNPHFFIMQGRITKVINMKPQETLSMIEEAAGTRMYENKKAVALKTLEKKQNKVEEINRLLSEEITPTLEKLQKERSNYMLWVSNNNEIERLERFCVAYEYVQFKNKLENKNQQLEEMEESLAQIAQSTKDLTSRDAAIQKEMKQRTASRDKARSQELKRLEDEHNKLSKDIASMESKLKNKQAELDSEKEQQKKSTSGMGDLRKQLQQKETVYEKEKGKFDKLTQEETATNQEIEKAQYSMQALTAGMAEAPTAEGEQCSLREQLLRTQTRLQEMQAEEKTKSMAIANLQERIASAEQVVGRSKQEDKRLSKEKAAIEAMLKEQRTKLQKAGFDPEVFNQTQHNLRHAEASWRSLQDKLDSLRAHLGGLDFNYSDPYRNFDRSTVKGVVAKLFHIKPDFAAYHRALEVCAGGRLFFVIVDNEETGKALLEKGQLRRRVTIIPLNKIQDNSIAPQVVRQARQIIPKKAEAHVAMEIVGFEKQVMNAMKFVFGPYMVCDTPETAKQITFHPNVRVKTVTKEGDLYDPAGTITGGSAPKGGNLLMKLQELSNLEKQVHTQRCEYDKANAQLQKMQSTASQFSSLERELKCKLRSFAMVSKHLIYVKLVLFTLLWKETNESVINPSNLRENGQNVCSRYTTQTESYYTTTATTSYTYSTTSCGWFGWGRCGVSRPKTVYRTIQRTRSVSKKVIYCCSGWRKRYSSSRECTEAICSQGCSSHGSCVSPNKCQCSTGWTGSTCVTDIDECASSNGGCDQICTNTPGSYQCGCNIGFTQSGHSCRDIDECQTLVPRPCSCGVPGEACGATCTNTVPGYSCSCAKGFQLRSGGTICDDINECSTANGGCQQRCHNAPATFSCGCFSGYRLTSQGNGACEDIDECQSSNGFCTHTCVNTDGSYRCECRSGYFLDSNGRSCSDHNECLLGHHGCQHDCNNFQGSYYCSCRSGYALSIDNKTCSDVNECNPVFEASLNKTITPAGCDQLCHNMQGNYTCSCNQGYQLLYDGKRCRDINECSTGAHSCEHNCHNTPGSYGCSCLYGYKLRADRRTCEGLPCEAIMDPPHGRMICPGLVTNETCWFRCEDGYELQGSEKRTCLNSSKWDGQQASCTVKHCGTLFPPENGNVLLPCYTTFGSTCTRECRNGYLAFGDSVATCRSINSSHVAWDIGNFTCEEIVLCRPNPCLHGGKCVIINSREFSCDCHHTGYAGDRCQTGQVIPPDFPKLIAGNPSDNLVLLAKPDDSLTVHFNPTMNLTFQPNELVIQYPTRKVDFQVTGHKPSVGMVSYDLTGVDSPVFASPKNSSIFIGRNTSNQESVYTKLGLLVGELPIGCQKKKQFNYQCDITVAFHSTTTVSADVRIESGPVHIITPDNKTIPLSLEGYDFSSPDDNHQKLLKRLIEVTEKTQSQDLNPVNQGCTPFQSTGETLMEFIQKDAFPKSFLQYFSRQVPLWLKLAAEEESYLFATENLLANLIQTTGPRYVHPSCKFLLTGTNSTAVIYRPKVNYSISVQNEQLLVSSKDCCFATDICDGGVFLTLSETVNEEIATMPFMKEMIDGRWKLSLSSLGFTPRRRYSTIVSSLPVGPLAEFFSDYHYNLWLQGSADIFLKNSNDFAVNIKLTGEAFVFVEDLDSLFTNYFSRPIKSMFHGSVEFNFTLRALGQRFFLTFHASSVTGKTILGGTPLLGSNCLVTQGFVFTLDPSYKLFENSLLSAVVQPYGGPKYLQIYHSIVGGEDIAVHDPKNNLKLLELQAQEIKRVLLDVQISVPELQPNVQKWSSKVDEMLINVIKARRLLSSSDFSKLKMLVANIDDDLDTILRVFDLLVAQLQPFKNRTSIETSIERFVRLKLDLPKTISLTFSKSSIQQNFLGVRFTLNGQICHKRLCFTNMKCNIWSLHDKSCLTTSSSKDAAVIVEGTALRDISLGEVLTYPVGRPLRMHISRNNKPLTTTFECFVDLLGLKRPTTITMIGHELSFAIRGPIFEKFDALLNVKAGFDNVVDWKSVVFEVEGTMNNSSRLYMMLESMIANETTLAAEEATNRLRKAQATFNDAKNKADAAKEALKLKQAAVEDLKIEKEKAAEEYRLALLQYHMAKVRFNNTVYFRQNIQNFMCEIMECNYTCFNGCVIPDLCQNPINITYLKRHCDTVDKAITVEVVQKSTETRRFEVATYQTVYTGNCRSGVPLKKILKYVKKGSRIGKVVGGFAGGAFGKLVGSVVGGLLGGLIGFFSKSIFGCSNTYERIPGEPQLIEYEHKIYDAKAVEKIIKEVRCTGQEEKTKRGGYGPPYPCCKQYGCQTKVIDPVCVKNNEECRLTMAELQFTLNAMNETFQSAFLSLRNSVHRVKQASSVYEKARIRHEFAVSTLKTVKSYTEQRLSAVEIVNASMHHVRRVVDFGLKIAQAINASSVDNTKTIDVGDMKFSFFMTSEDKMTKKTKKILFQSEVSSRNGQQTAVSFLVDFDQVKRSVSSASKIIIAKLFGSKHSRKRRSDETNAANSTHALDATFTDYPYACLFANRTRLYLSSIFQSLGDLISSVKGLKVNLSSGFHDLEMLAQTVQLSSSSSNASSVNTTTAYPNSSFVTEYMEMIQVLKEESSRLTNDSSQSWNDTFEAWRAFLEALTSNNEFEECSGTEDCIEYFFEGTKEFYEFEDSPRALAIKDALPQLREVVRTLTTNSLTMTEAEQTLHQAFSLLIKTRDDSVLCGGKPRITSSSPKEIILLPGDSLSLSCTAESEAELTYAWKKNNKVIKESRHGTLFERAVSKQHEGVYVCVVSNNKGSTLSNVTIVKVHKKPQITHHPQAQRVVVGSQVPAMFICNATGQPSPSFQWFFQSPNSSVLKLNKTKPVLYMANPRRHHEGYYYCEASNEHGTEVSQRARLDVLGYSIGVPRLLVGLNLTSLHCGSTSNSSNSSTVQDPPPCHSLEELPSSNENLTATIIHALARSLNISYELISEFDYDSRNTSTAIVAFILDIDNKGWKVEKFTSHMEIVEALANVKANFVDKLEQFNSDIQNKTFALSWNNATLLGEPGTLVAYPLSPECPEGKALSENGYICANCPAGMAYNRENETCVECPLGTYQPIQGQTECISCGTNLTTAFNGTVEEEDCIADCPAGSYSTRNRTCSVCPLGSYQPSRGQPSCISCGKNLTTISNGTVEEVHCIGNCPAGSHSTENRTCISCPLGTYQPSDGQKDCLPCGQGLATTSTGATNQSQCIEPELPSSDIPATKKQSTLTASPSIFKTNVTEVLTTKDAGQTEEQENAKDAPWKLPVFVVAPVVVISLIAGIVLVFYCKKKRKQRPETSHSNLTYASSGPKPSAQTASHSNPMYEVSKYKPGNETEGHEYALMEMTPPPEWSKSQSDLEEQWYGNIGNEELLDEFTGEPVYACLEPSQKGNHAVSFTNQSFLTSSDT